MTFPGGHARLVVGGIEATSLAHAARMAGLPVGTLRSRLEAGWSAGRAITEPVDPLKRKRRRRSVASSSSAIKVGTIFRRRSDGLKYIVRGIVDRLVVVRSKPSERRMPYERRWWGYYVMPKSKLLRSCSVVAGR